MKKFFLAATSSRRCGMALSCVLLSLAACQSMPGLGGGNAVAAKDVPAVAQNQFATALTAQRAQQWSDAEREYSQMLERYPGLSGPALNLALIYTQTQRPQLAEDAFKRALQINPDNVVAGDQYGAWLRTQGRFADAEAVYLQTLARNGDYADAHLNLAILYDLYLAKMPQALEHYQRYLELHGEEPSPVSGYVADLQRRLQKAG